MNKKLLQILNHIRKYNIVTPKEKEKNWRPSKYDVSIDYFLPSFISGWVHSTEVSDVITIDIYLDGVFVKADVQSQFYRPDLEQQLGTDGRHGFRVFFPSLISTSPCLVKLNVSGSDETIFEATMQPVEAIGALEGIKNRKISGWCYTADQSYPNDVRLLIGNGEGLLKPTFDLPRADVLGGGIDEAVGFDILIPNDIQIVAGEQIKLIRQGQGQPIAQRAISPKEEAEATMHILETQEEKTVVEPNEENSTPQSTDGLKQKVNIKKLKSLVKDHFDYYYYEQKYNIKREKALDHFLEEGWRLGMDPAGWFSTNYYLEKNIDVAKSGLNPLHHYVRYGMAEGRITRKRDEEKNYLESPWTSADGRVEIASCYKTGSSLHVSGTVFNDRYPGVPLRVKIKVNNIDQSVFLARTKPESMETNQVESPDILYFSGSVSAAGLDDTGLLSVTPLNSDEEHLIKISIIQEADIKIKYPDPDPSWDVVGAVDTMTEGRVAGWALYPQSQLTPLTLALYLNGSPISTTACQHHRPDLRIKFGDGVYAGFIFDLPPNVAARADLTKYELRPIVGQNKIRRSSGTLSKMGCVILDPAGHSKRNYTESGQAAEDISLSMVVLNSNGADILNDTLLSASNVENKDLLEWIIIDHGSTDHSDEVVAAAIARGQDVKFIRRIANASFSSSNNLGANLAKNDIVVFANNDLIFRAPFRQEITDTLSNSEIGLVGSVLYDYVESKEDTYSHVIQHAAIGFYKSIPNKYIRPQEIQLTQDERKATNGKVMNVSAVTGAFIGMRKADFFDIGGFDEKYIYGLEDVDLCLKVRYVTSKKVVCNMRLDIVHHRGFTRKKNNDISVRQRSNNIHFNKKWGSVLRHEARKNFLDNPVFSRSSRPLVAFIVADAGDKTTAGEYYTALEFGSELQKIMPCQIRFLTKADWYDLQGIDMVIVMVVDFDIHSVKTANPFLITVNWTRQWFDRWVDRGTLPAYDIVLASSQRAADYITELTGLDVHCLPIASNFETFSQNGKVENRYRSDYCFTGNFVGTKRELTYQLFPDEIDAEGVVFGAGWEGTAFENISRGLIPYADMKDVYASTKIVVDDGNIATKDWGSCNSRVFDALASGRLLVTNSAKGVQELFGDLVPVFDTPESLKEIIEYWTNNDGARTERVLKLQKIVKENHTYAHRASQFVSILDSQKNKLRVAIKCPAKWNERESWGDYHFANALAKELRALGFTVRVDCRESWKSGLSMTDDVNIVLRGILEFDPPAHQLNIMWMISHPADVTATELENFDKIYVASNVHYETLKLQLSVPVEPLLQCTDMNVFNMQTVSKSKRGKSPAIFVGNSRGIFRSCVKWALESDQNIDVYGKGWDQFVGEASIKGTYVPNNSLSEFYGRACYVLCDHWDDMAKYGYLSNRAFDVLASGSLLVVDEVAGLSDILPGGYEVFTSKDELKEILKTKPKSSPALRTKLSKWVSENHTVTKRAEVFADFIRSELSFDEPSNGTFLAKGTNLLKGAK